MQICITFVVLEGEPDYNSLIYSFSRCTFGPQFRVISMLNCDVRASSALLVKVVPARSS